MSGNRSALTVDEINPVAAALFPDQKIIEAVVVLVDA